MAYVGPYVGTVIMVDEHGLRAAKQFDIYVDDAIVLTEDARIASARQELVELAGKLDDITDLQITSVSLRVETVGSVVGLKGAPLDQGSAEGAIVRLYKQNKTTLHPYWIPGASAGVFLPDFATVDVSDADLQDFFQEFRDGMPVIPATQVRFSDGELLDDAEGLNGLHSGYFATKQRSSA